MLNLFGKNVFARKRKAKAMPIETISRIETLEDRVVLASQILVVYDAVNGNLTLNGSGDADDVAIAIGNSNNNINLTTSGTFTGAGAGPFNVTGNLIINMGNGNDQVTFSGVAPGNALDSGNVYIDLGSGDDSLTMAAAVGSSVVFTGDVSIVGGTGAETITIGSGNASVTVANLTIDTGVAATNQTVSIRATRVNGNLSVTQTGSANNTLTLQGDNTTLNTVTGSLTVVQTGGANYSTAVNDYNVNGNVSITHGSSAGGSTIDFNAALGVRTVGGNAVLTNGDNAAQNRVSITGAAAGNAVFAGNVTATNGVTTGVTGNLISIDAANFTKANGSVSLKNGSGINNDITLGATTTNTFQGTVAANNASAVAGTNDVTIGQGTLTKSLTITNGVNSLLAVENTVTLGSVATLNVTGPTSITNANTAGTGTNSVIIGRLTTSVPNGNVTIKNGTTAAGNTVVTLGGAGANLIQGNLIITNLASTGTRSVTIDNTTVNGRSGLAVNESGAGNSTLSLGVTSPVVVASKLDIQDGTGSNGFTAQALNAGSITYNDLGGGVDTINLGNTGAGTTTVNGVTRINTGNGNDVLNIGNVGAVFNGLVSVSLGSGNDAVDIGSLASSPAFGSANRYQFDGGSGVDSFNADPLSLSDYELPGGVLPRKLRAKITNFETLGF